MSKPPVQGALARGRKPRTLTAKQKSFISEYLIDKNATQAAKRAGYSAKTAEVLGWQLLQIPLVSAEIQKGLEAQRQHALVTADYVISGLKTVAERSIQAEAVLDHEGKETGEYRFDSSGANKAFDLLGKHIGLWNENKPLADAVNNVAAASVAVASRDKEAMARILAKTKSM